MAGEELATSIDASTWLTPLDAVAYAMQAIPTKDSSAACAAIWERLKAGLIRTIATSSSRTSYGSSPQASTTPMFIPANHWDHFRNPSSLNFWSSSDAQFYWSARGHSSTSLTVRCFGIKLDPAHVRATLPVPPPPPTPKPQPQPPPPPTSAPTVAMPAPTEQPTPVEQAEADSRPKGPPVPEALLKAWHELYCKAYGGSSADTLGNAQDSARGMFPGKFVSRDRVRKLVGGRKPGRKPSDADG